MKRVLAWLMAMMMLIPALGLADPVMAGYDAAETGHDWDNNRFFLAMEEKTGLRFVYRQFKDAAEYQRYKTGLKAEGELPAVLFKASLTPGEEQALYDAGVLRDLRPLLPEWAPNLWALLQAHPDWLAAISLPDGAIVSLPLLDPLLSNNLIWINKRWLTMTQQAMPETPEALTEVLRAFKAGDPNRNSKADEIPLTFTGMWDLRFLQHAFGLVTNDYYLTRDEAGQIVCGITGDRSRAFLAWLHDLWAEELLDHSGFTTSDTTRKLSDSATTIPYGVVFGTSPMSLLPAKAAEDYTALLLHPAGEAPVYRSFMGAVVRGTFAVTTACENPGEMLRWADVLYTEEGCFMARAGVLDEDYQRDADGKWRWLYSAEQVASLVSREDTIDAGSPIPGYVPESFNLSFDDVSANRLVAEFAQVASVAREAVPQMSLTPEEEARLAALMPALSAYCETRMTWFVTGDWPLDDAHWEEFCSQIDALGMAEIIQIWQRAADRQKEADHE
ncbi:MAG: hypothetical protein IKH77_00485 [Clostridia bacterium]|nr:hypothetical protein [Clostridia bacterium]